MIQQASLADLMCEAVQLLFEMIALGIITVNMQELLSMIEEQIPKFVTPS